MKKYVFLTLLSLFFSLSFSWSQSDVSRSSSRERNLGIFEDGYRGGRNSDGTYLYSNNGKKGYTLSEIQREAGRREVVLSPDYSKRTEKRLGMVREEVESIAFYPKDEFPAYMFAQITKILGNGTSFSDLNSRGKAKLYYYYAGDVRRLRDDGFFEYDNIYWSGDESGGMIRGNGVGLAINDRWVCFFQGRFEEGWPTGETKYAWVNWEGHYGFFQADGKFRWDDNTLHEIFRCSFHSGYPREGRLSYQRGDRWGFVDLNSGKMLRTSYRQIVKDYNDGKAIVVRASDSKEIVIDGQGNFLDFSDNQKQKDKEEELRKEEEARLAQLKREEEKREAELREKELEKRKREGKIEEVTRRQEIKTKARKNLIMYYCPSLDKDDWYLDKEYWGYAPEMGMISAVQIPCLIKEVRPNDDKTDILIKVLVGELMVIDGELGGKRYKFTYDAGDEMWIRSDSKGWFITDMVHKGDDLSFLKDVINKKYETIR